MRLPDKTNREGTAKEEDEEEEEGWKGSSETKRRENSDIREPRTARVSRKRRLSV